MKSAAEKESEKKYSKYCVAVIVLFSVIVLCLAGIYRVSGDACWHLSSAKFISENLKFPLFEPLGRDEPFWSPPVFHVVAAFFYGIFNSMSNYLGNIIIKMIAPVFGILTMIFSYLIIKKLSSPKTAFYSLLFLAPLPIFIDYSVMSYVEGALAFFTVLGIYFALGKKVFLASISAGLAFLSKYNGILAIALVGFIFFVNRKGKKEFVKNCSILIIVSLIIAAPWLARNYSLLGNPIWPFLNFAFKGYEMKSYTGFDIGRLGSINFPVFTYLGVFGVPDGNYTALKFIDIPYFNALFSLWLLGTLIFILPAIFGMFSDNKAPNKKIFYAWAIIFMVITVLYVPNVGFSVTRIFFPAFPALAFFWAIGFEKILSKKYAIAAMVLISLIGLGLVGTEVYKFKLSSVLWEKYDDDFSWVKSNVPSDAVFIANGMCIPYNLERKSYNSGMIDFRKTDYIWVNQDFSLDTLSKLPDATLKEVLSKNYQVAYSNKKTGTTIYKVN